MLNQNLLDEELGRSIVRLTNQHGMKAAIDQLGLALTTLIDLEDHGRNRIVGSPKGRVFVILNRKEKASNDY